MNPNNTLFSFNSSDVNDIIQQNTLLRRLFEYTKQPAMFIANPSDCFRFIMVNDAVCEHFGLTREQLLQCSPLDFDPNFELKDLDELAAYMDTHKTITFETEHVLTSGHIVPVEISANTFEYNGRNLVVGYFQYIDSKQQKEPAPQESAKSQLEQRYRQVFANLADCVCILEIDPQNNATVLDVNSATVKTSKKSPYYFIGNSIDNLFPEEKAKKFNKYKNICLQTGEACFYQESLDNEEPVYLDISMTPIKNAFGKIERIVLVSRDITQQKQKEHLLIQREQEVLALVEHSKDIVVRYNTDLERIYVNPAFMRALGVENENDILGKTPIDGPQKSPISVEVYELLDSVVKHEHPRTADLSYIKDEQEYCYEVHILPEFNTDKKLISILIIGRDYSQRKRIQNALEKSEEKFRTLVENAPDTISRHDLQGRRIYLNPQSAKLSGSIYERLMNSTPAEYPGGTEGENYQNKIMEVIRTGEKTELQVRWDSSCGTNYSLISLVPEHNDAGKIISVLAVGRDITLLNEIKEELESSRRQLRDLSAYRELTREHERKYIAREVHDELGQQLTALKIETQILEMRYGNLDPNFKLQLERIKQQLKNTISFTRNLVFRLRPGVLDMGVIPALEWLRDDFQLRSPTCQCHFITETDVVRLSDDIATAIFRIVQESLTNIAKHAQANFVEIHLKEENNQLNLTIHDNGKGFDTSKRCKDSSFGLMGIKERALMINAELRLTSSEGKGTRLELNIPIKSQRHT